MSESLLYSRIRGENQSCFLGSGKLLGIDSILIQNNLGSQSMNYLGIGNKQTFQIPNSEQSSEVTLNSYLINSDPFISLTGKEPINMFILKDKNNINNNYCLISGYLSSYSAKFGINQIPQISTSLKFYKNSGPIPLNNLDPLSSGQLVDIQNNNYDIIPSGLEIPYGGSLDLTLDEYNIGNRVQDFNIDIAIDRIAINNIGARFPKRLDIIFPINTKCSFTFDASNYSGIPLTDFPQSKKTQNISMVVNGQNGTLITSYSLPNMTLINENISQTTDNNKTITRSYQGYLKE